METAILLLVLLNLILTGAGLVLLVLERRDVLLQKEPEPKPESVLRVDPDKYMEPATVTNIKPVPIRPRPPFGPPMVGEETLKSWLIHLYNNDGVWSRFVEDFYVRAMTNHLVRPYFEGKDTQEIQKKFLAVGAIPHAMDAAQFTAFLKSEDQRWSKVIAQSGIKAD